MSWIKGRDRKKAHLEILQGSRKVDLHIRNGNIQVDFAVAPHVHVLRPKRSQSPFDAKQVANGHERVRANQDATCREDTRVGQATENPGRGSIGRAGPSRAQLRHHPHNPGNVGRERGVFASESRLQAIHPGRIAPQIELPSLAARKRSLVVNVGLAFDLFRGERAGQAANGALGLKAQDVVQELHIQRLRFERQAIAHGGLYVEYHEPTYNAETTGRGSTGDR